MDEKKNLRNREDHLIYYREVETGSYEERARLVDIYDEVSKKVYYYPQKEKVIFTEDEVRKFSLDRHGEHIPYVDGQLTILNNYFFDYWGYYLGAEGTSLYAHLKRYAYGDKDYCYPNIELICEKMDKSRPTINKYIEILERYGFVFKFGVLNKDKNMLEETSLYKIRRQIPLLTKKLIYGNPNIEIPENAPAHIKKALQKERKGLPEKLRAEHEKFVSRHVNNNITINLEDSIDYETIYKAWETYGELLKNKKPSTKKIVSKNNAIILNSMNEHEKIILSFILEEASKKISKPSFDTWFKNILLKCNQKTLIIYAPNQFAKDWLQNNYKDLIMDCLSKLEKLEIEELIFEEITKDY